MFFIHTKGSVSI